MKFNQIRIAIIQREIETPRHGTLMHRLNVVNIEIEKKNHPFNEFSFNTQTRR